MAYPKDKTPAEGQAILVKASKYCPEGYTVAVYENGKYMREPNGDISEYIEEWVSMDTVEDAFF